jgi:hypothetical protein
MVLKIDFTLSGQHFQDLTADEILSFNEAVSFVIECEDQAEVDRLGIRSRRAEASRVRADRSRTNSGCRADRAAPAERAGREMIRRAASRSDNSGLLNIAPAARDR